MTEKWFAFKTYNTATLYGFGTKLEASEYQDFLNSNRLANHYSVVTVNDQTAINGIEFNIGDELQAIRDGAHHMTEPSRKHFFRDEQDNRAVVITTLLPTGEYGAYREDEDGGQCRGFGHSRLAAIADLQQWIEDNEEAQDPRWTY